MRRVPLPLGAVVALALIQHFSAVWSIVGEDSLKGFPDTRASGSLALARAGAILATLSLITRHNSRHRCCWSALVATRLMFLSVRTHAEVPSRTERSFASHRASHRPAAPR